MSDQRPDYMGAWDAFWAEATEGAESLWVENTLWVVVYRGSAYDELISLFATRENAVEAAAGFNKTYAYTDRYFASEVSGPSVDDYEIGDDLWLVYGQEDQRAEAVLYGVYLDEDEADCAAEEFEERATKPVRKMRMEVQA
jgi:hypothetical protein